ncbi:hypothetical protein M2169_003540 [Streptomyces sp. MJP52]|nr:hypothetical protein [Streptomyces sp. MJP52]
MAASARAGCPSGTPSVTEDRCFSTALVRSQCSSTSSGVAADSSPKTCGCRWISLATRPPATSSTENGSSSSSSAIRAWKTTWSSTSPSSSRNSSRLPVSIASTSSYASSSAYLARPSWVCREVHGQSARTRSITWTRSSSRAPGRS